MFDSIINEADQRFDLHGRASTLLSALLSMITDRAHNGFPGFLRRFQEAGLGVVIDSWVSGEVNLPISGEQTEAALGEKTLRELAARTGIEYEKTAAATAFMLPHVVDSLTPAGSVTDDEDLLSRVGMDSTTGDDKGFETPPAPVDRVGTAAAGVIDRSDVSFGQNIEAAAGTTGTPSDPLATPGVPAGTDRKSLWNWLLPLLLVALLLLLGFSFCSGSPA